MKEVASGDLRESLNLVLEAEAECCRYHFGLLSHNQDERDSVHSGSQREENFALPDLISVYNTQAIHAECFWCPLLAERDQDGRVILVAC